MYIVALGLLGNWMLPLLLVPLHHFGYHWRNLDSCIEVAGSSIGEILYIENGELW